MLKCECVCTVYVCVCVCVCVSVCMCVCVCVCVCVCKLTSSFSLLPSHFLHTQNCIWFLRSKQNFVYFWRLHFLYVSSTLLLPRKRIWDGEDSNWVKNLRFYFQAFSLRVKFSKSSNFWSSNLLVPVKTSFLK